MAQKLTGSMPDGMDLAFTYTIEWAALDPVTGDDVAGVVISEATMLVTQVSPGTAEDLVTGPFMLVPGPSS